MIKLSTFLGAHSFDVLHGVSYKESFGNANFVKPESKKIEHALPRPILSSKRNCTFDAKTFLRNWQ